jgi:hypothetical protein
MEGHHPVVEAEVSPLGDGFAAATRLVEYWQVVEVRIDEACLSG